VAVGVGALVGAAVGVGAALAVGVGVHFEAGFGLVQGGEARASLDN